uniref:Receptor-binding cancer antigen expressed on SiSo cells n=1 Tax=Ascaris lumbricoides TaxID=6252 RepID=A0A0M3ILI1_ASCLU
MVLSAERESCVACAILGSELAVTSLWKRERFSSISSSVAKNKLRFSRKSEGILNDPKTEYDNEGQKYEPTVAERINWEGWDQPNEEWTVAKNEEIEFPRKNTDRRRR